MMPSHKRALLYGGAALSLVALGFAVANGHCQADALTLLSSADVQLRLAHGMPAKDRHGAPLTARAEMIKQSVAQLALVERELPGLAVTAEFMGFAHMLQGQFGEAAAAYGKARQCTDCGEEQRDVLAFNQARMLAQAGQRDEALVVFAQNKTALDARYGPQRLLEEATILRELGRPSEATARLDQVLQNPTVSPMASLQAGLELAQLGHLERAASAFASAAEHVPIADYHLARLKLQQGHVDTCLGLLGRVAKVLPTEVRRRLQDEAVAWSVVAADARFQEILQSGTATPVR